jgi:antitoxin ParD1/3/4
MYVNLTPDLEQWVQQKVASGTYNDAGEVVSEALRLMEETERERTAKLAWLRQAIQEGIDSGSAGSLDMEEIISKARAEKAAKQSEQRS